ncbi:DUF6702 family protein [Prosthecobacter sp.]|uniref:DUF6702 family protein n=1 Tax=Prosthecobacter sp. TaxID=1965333 RepID=UPI0037836F63
MRFLPFIFYFLAGVPLHAHAVHTSTAEAEYNAETKRLEVSLTVFVSDLQLALVRQSEREMKIDQTPAAEFDAQIQAYLAKTFVVTDAAGRAGKIRWVGREMEKESEKSGDPAVVLFFEVEVPGGVEGAAVRDAVFCDLFEDQINLLNLMILSTKVEMQFKRGDESKKIDATDAGGSLRHGK